MVGDLPGGSVGFSRAFAEELKAEYERVGLDHPTLDLAFVAFVRQLARFGVFTLGPISISIAPLERWVDEAAASGSLEAQGDAGFARLFEGVAREMRRTGASRPTELHYLLAFMRVGEGLPHRVFSELGVSPEQVEEFVRGRSGAALEERLYSPEEAARYLGIKVETVRAWIRSGRLRASRLAGQRVLRIRASDLAAVLEPVEVEAEEDRSR